ncbi:hypothetical protein DFJ43DRAFT_1155946 [Lentinula guzmanii]|uniref:Uncharacterized protein n=1 Tax=Lentinula guzmanii TaxID=2804957 RepID=A0AA38J7U0_9AGAR|nr:hypothetical protein DFJ43DRAFT_1155946 [Lentinula guzmanii]
MQDENQTDEAETLDTNTDQCEGYLELLNSHLSSHDEDDEIDWSEDEKDHFFAALSSYSVLRPDLIAEAIGTKNVAQVCVYLSVLEAATRDCDAEPPRSNLDIAMEVPDEWLEVEEEQAAFFRDIELAWRRDMSSQDQDISEPARENVNMTNMRTDALRNLSIDHLKVIDKMLRNDGAQTGTPTSPATDMESQVVAELSPAERRRMHKRLHMRRKRAEMAGTGVVTDAQRLQRGRKRKIAHAPSSSRAPSQSASDRANSDESGEEKSADDARPKKRQRKRGLTREQKVVANFSQLGIDAGVVHDLKLDSLHLHPLGRLIALYQEAFSPAEAPVTAISPDTIRLLDAVILDFVTQVIHRAIILREQELLLKRRTKAWHDDNKDISPDIIARATAMLGYPTSKAQAFEHLCGEDDCSADDQVLSEQLDDDPEGRSEGADDRDDGLVLPLQSISPLSHLELFPSLIRLPMRCFESTETLMPVETDEELLNEELTEEDELDEQDQVSEKIHLDELWAAHKQSIAACGLEDNATTHGQKTD